MKEPTRPRFTIALALAALLLTACDKKEESKTATAQATQVNASAPRAGNVPATPPAMPAAPARAATTDIANAVGDTPGTRVEVQELKRTAGDTLSLKFTIVNGSDQPLAFGYEFVEKGKESVDIYSIGGVHLIDAAGKKKYFVVRDSEGICACSRGLQSSIQRGSYASLWAKFPSPPEDVQKISVVVPHFQPMDDVPISR